jgi:hypothetical protein
MHLQSPTQTPLFLIFSESPEPRHAIQLDVMLLAHLLNLGVDYPIVLPRHPSIAVMRKPTALTRKPTLGTDGVASAD